MALLMEILAEYRPLIDVAIPMILDFKLNIDDRTSHLAVAKSLSILLKHGRVARSSFKACLIQVDMAEFQPLITPNIPENVNLFKDSNWEACCTGADALLQHLDQGKTRINQVWWLC